VKTNSNEKTAAFAPILYLDNVADAIEFYKKAFDAKELRRWSNDEIHPVQDYDYGYRQGDIRDPSGHCWTIEKSIWEE